MILPKVVILENLVIYDTQLIQLFEIGRHSSVRTNSNLNKEKLSAFCSIFEGSKNY